MREWEGGKGDAVMRKKDINYLTKLGHLVILKKDRPLRASSMRRLKNVFWLAGHLCGRHNTSERLLTAIIVLA
jgi:hypothetical protein